jgi:hypothetical protein
MGSNRTTENMLYFIEILAWYGGGRGTGFEPSPRDPAQWNATPRASPITALPGSSPVARDARIKAEGARFLP